LGVAAGAALLEGEHLLLEGERLLLEGEHLLTEGGDLLPALLLDVSPRQVVHARSLGVCQEEALARITAAILILVARIGASPMAARRIGGIVLSL